MDDFEVRRLLAVRQVITSKNYAIIRHGCSNLDSIAAYAFDCFQAGRLTKDDYHNMIVALMDTKNCFDLLEAKLVANARPKNDVFGAEAYEQD